MDSNKRVTYITFKRKYGLRQEVITPNNYFLRLVKYNKQCDKALAIVDQDTITLKSGHKFVFKPIETKGGPVNGYGYFNRLVTRKVLIIEDEKVNRFFLINYPLTAVGDMIEIEISHYILPSLNKLDFLRKSFNSGEVVGNELLQLLTEKARKELSKIRVNYEIDSPQVLDIRKEDASKPLTIEFVRINYNIETAKDFSKWLHTIYHNNILRNAHNQELSLKEKIVTIEMIIKSLTKYRRAVKELSFKL